MNIKLFSKSPKIHGTFSIPTFSALVFLLVLFIPILNPLRAQPDPELQLAKDPTLVPMGKGAIFVPYLVDSQREPRFSIYKNGFFVKDAEPGRRISLNPGKYEVHLGSGPLPTRMKFEATVIEERVTVIKPVWSALIVETLDEFNSSIRQGFQIFDEKDKMTIGHGTGIDESVGEKPIIWILKPGLYRIAKKGEGSDSLRNFITVRIVPGKVTYASMILEENTFDLVGGGENLERAAEAAEKGNWRQTAILSGIFSLTNSGTINSKSNETNYNIGTRVNGILTYDTSSLLFITRLDIQESFIKTENEQILNIRDKARFNSLLFYRINQWVGPYLSILAKTRLFFNYKDLSDSSGDFVKVERDGTESEVDGSDLFLLGKSFSPTTVQEGAGINFEVIRGNLLRASARTGFGWRQTFADYLYDDTREKGKLFRVDSFNHAYGPETSLSLSLNPLSYLQLTLDFLGLLPINRETELSYSFDSTVSLWLSRFATIQYEFTLEKDPAVAEEATLFHGLSIQLFYRLL